MALAQTHNPLIVPLTLALQARANLVSLSDDPDRIPRAERRYEEAAARLSATLATTHPVSVAEVAPLLRVMGVNADGPGVPITAALADAFNPDVPEYDAFCRVRKIVDRWAEHGEARRKWFPLYELVYTP